MDAFGVVRDVVLLAGTILLLLMAFGGPVCAAKDEASLLPSDCDRGLRGIAAEGRCIDRDGGGGAG
jgi:hypothetical protein